MIDFLRFFWGTSLNTSQSALCDCLLETAKNRSDLPTLSLFRSFSLPYRPFHHKACTGVHILSVTRVCGAICCHCGRLGTRRLRIGYSTVYTMQPEIRLKVSGRLTVADAISNWSNSHRQDRSKVTVSDILSIMPLNQAATGLSQSSVPSRSFPGVLVVHAPL